MPQQINFYTELPKPPRYQLSAEVMMVVIGVIGFLLLLSVVAQMIMLESNKKIVVDLQKAYTFSSNKFSDTTRLFAKTNVTYLKEDLRQKKILLQTLQARKITSGQCSLFSNYLQSLSDNTVTGLWLTNITVDLNNDKIALTGQTYSPIFLLKFVQLTHKAMCFSKRKLETIELTKQTQETSASNPADSLLFVLKSSASNNTNANTNKTNINISK